VKAKEKACPVYAKSPKAFCIALGLFQTDRSERFRTLPRESSKANRGCKRGSRMHAKRLCAKHKKSLLANIFRSIPDKADSSQTHRCFSFYL